MKEYRNWSNKVITEEQAIAKGDYYIFEYENESLRRIDNYIGHTLISKTYVLLAGETHNDLIASYYDPKYFFAVIEVVTLPFGIKVHSRFIYDDIVLKFIERFAYDNYDNIVASEIIFDPSTGVPDFSQTNKLYFDHKINPNYH